jgi:hypothetical protein
MNEYGHPKQKAVGVKVTWVTMNHPSMPYARKEVENFDFIIVDWNATDLDVCEEVYKQTNLYEGDFYERVEKFAPKDRGHTAISVGDFVDVEGNVYECADFGWNVVSKKDEAVNA